MLLILLIFFLLAHPSTSLAVNSPLNLVTSPLPLNLVTTPGSSVSTQLKIKNGGTQTETLQVGLMKFLAFGEEGKPRILDREKGDDYFDWAKFSEDSFELAPNEWKTITMTINVPKSAAFGYYYAVTFQRKDNEVDVGARSTKIVGATASLVLLEVRVPNAIRDIEVSEFSANKSIFEFLPTRFTIKLKNKGNVHVAPRGNIFIGQGNKRDVGVLEINEFKGNVLPDSSRVFEARWSDGFPVYQEKIDGNRMVTDRLGNPKQELSWDFSKIQKLRVGKYQATMLLVYDDGQRDIPIEANLSFWVIPWRLVGGGIGMMGLMLAGLYVVIKSLVPIVIKRKK